MSEQECKIEDVIDFYIENQHRLILFQKSVNAFFSEHPKLNQKPFPIIHSVKTRLKDPSHLKDKIERKLQKGIKISKENLLAEITDLIGIRVLHLYQDQFPIIHNEILKFIEQGDWIFVDDPKAMTWDPESKQMYENLQIATEVRSTLYTSVHYVIKPNNNNLNPVCCEIQVRTLFEEIWGEIDHNINYPHPTDNIACKEQLKVLSKLVGTGTRLADSIFRTLNDHNEKRTDL